MHTIKESDMPEIEPQTMIAEQEAMAMDAMAAAEADPDPEDEDAPDAEPVTSGEMLAAFAEAMDAMDAAEAASAPRVWNAHLQMWV